jgi:hypothetical protein
MLGVIDFYQLHFDEDPVVCEFDVSKLDDVRVFHLAKNGCLLKQFSNFVSFDLLFGDYLRNLNILQ